MIKNILCIVGLTLGLQTAWGFALLGPNPGIPGQPATAGDPWQTVAIGYDLGGVDNGFPGGGFWLGDLGGPKNLAEEYQIGRAHV